MRVRFTAADVWAKSKVVNLTDGAVIRLAQPLTFAIANFTAASPNAISLTGAAFGLLGSLFFFLGLWPAAALAFALFFLLDVTDGTVARLKDQGSERGAVLDLVCDRLVLLTAVLSRLALHLRQGDAVEAWLCAAYLAAHYAIDLGWLLDIRRDAARPPQFAALVRELDRQRHATPGRGSLSRLAALEARVRPIPWVCNIVFIAGAAFAPGALRWVYLAAILGLAWPVAVRGAKGLARRRGGRT